MGENYCTVSKNAKLQKKLTVSQSSSAHVHSKLKESENELCQTIPILAKNSENVESGRHDISTVYENRPSSIVWLT